MPKDTSLRAALRRKPLPRRVSSEERWRKYRREHMKPAGPIDNWLCACSGLDDPDRTLSRDEVRCTVTVQVYKPVTKKEDIFIDPNVYELRLTVATRCVDEEKSDDDTHPQVVLERWEGHDGNRSAPEWTQRKPGRKLVFIQSTADLAEFLLRLATWRDNFDPLIQKLKAMKAQ